MSASDVYVAIVPLKYEVMAVADTAHAAVRIACRRALKQLREADAVYPETSTINKIRDFFAVSAQRVMIGTAVIVGVDE
jgi:hypothetical protein